ncbi:dihydrofolate reductase family protein [Pseudoxanthomonas suwonensis]|uniref:dihydrofolate reductase family protein n=1 Tax=Pseudoxanthomonas suwonensis TaxID=314722 RepID=UPI00138EF448|nr:dihydrofolate reductase family protein [Pseudoxanthomonas suwonensis]KAF1702260.1 deaminase [Pseudoxanthomonas suwonensis]
MTTQYYTASSLDGYIATEDDSLEWLFPLADLEQTTYSSFISEVGAIAMGSSTYEWLLRHAVKLGTVDEGVWPYSQPTWIFTTRKLDVPAGADIRFAQGDIQHVHAQMKEVANTKNIWVMGGGELAGQFFDAGLLDELIVQIGSVSLGRGKSVFPRRVFSPTLRLTSVNHISEGMAELRYRIDRGCQAGPA